MGDNLEVAAQDLRAAAVVDLAAALADPVVQPWVWQPFGDAGQRQEAIDAARMMAECEYAVVEAVQPAEANRVTIYTDQINLTVPAAYRFVVREVDQ